MNSPRRDESMKGVHQLHDEPPMAQEVGNRWPHLPCGESEIQRQEGAVPGRGVPLSLMGRDSPWALTASGSEDES